MMTIISVIIGLIAVVVLGSIIVNLRVVVPTDEVHIVQTADKTTSYGKGLEAGNVYYSWAEWLPVIGIVRTVMPVSVFAVNLQGYDAYDTDRLPFKVDLTAFFRITDSNTAAQRVSNFEQLREQLVSIVQGSARSILASSDINEIMKSRSEYGEKFTQEVDGQLADWGVQTVKSIELMDIRDSDRSNVIENIMARKKSEIEKDSRIEVANNKKTAEVSETENLRDSAIAKEQAQQQVGIREAEKSREVGLAREQAQQTVQESAKLTTEREMAVKRVNDTQKAEIAKAVTETRAAEDRIRVEVEAKARLEADKLDAEGIKAKAAATANEIKVTGVATAESAKLLEMANVSPQIELAREIGENEGYQSYLIEVRKVEMSETVGLKQAEALGKAEMKIIANSGSIDNGAQSLMNVLTPDGGMKAVGGLEALANSDAGQALLAKYVGELGVK